MCSQAKCSRCDKVTWRGCGSHVDQVMARVPMDARCTCDRDKAPSLGGFKRIFGRG